MTNIIRQKASALITTLFVLVVLSTIVLAFLESTSLEQKISRNIKTTYQAELVSEAGLAEAVGRIYETTRTGPYSAVYLPTNGNPYLFLAKRDYSEIGIVTRRLPLFSTGQTNFDALTNFSAAFLSTAPLTILDTDSSGASVSRELTATNDLHCDINATNSTFPNGVVGLRSAVGGSAHPNLPVNWIYFRDNSGKVVGRYAYWSDDECSKLDLRHVGNDDNPSGMHARSNGEAFSELSLLALTNLPGVTDPTIFANALAFQSPATTDLPLSVTELRYALPGGGDALSPDVAEAVRPYVTVYSKHDDRSPDGKRRIDLNELITSQADIATQTLAIRDAITNNLPEFGKRFYSASGGVPTTPTPAHQKAYATRIAANIRDFIDADLAATMILADESAYGGNEGDFIAFDPSVQLDSDLPLAFGKDAPGVYLSEYMRVARVISPNPHPPSSTTPVTIRVRFGHYVELHNMSGHEIRYQDLGSDPHILLCGRGDWINAFASGTPERLRLSDLKIRLPLDMVIPPGGFFYITTDAIDPGEAPGISTAQAGILGNQSNWHQAQAGPGPGQWELVNTDGNTSPIATDFEDYQIVTRATNKSGRSHYAVYDSPDASNPTYAHQRERLLLANAGGIMDCAFRIYTTRRQYLGRDLDNPARAGSFLGDPESSTANNAPSGSASARYSRGEPRSNFDLISVLAANTGVSWRDGNSGDYGDPASDSYATLGTTNYNTAQNHTGVHRWRKGWYEYTDDAAGNVFFHNASIHSIAHLGHVYDPVRHDIQSYRSQGATLRIGQSDSPTNNRATNSGVDYQNWLGGRGSDDPSNAVFGRNAFLLMDVFRTDPNTAGRINPNSIVRDGGEVVMRAALSDFVYETEATNGASSLLGGQLLNMTNAVTAIRDFATNTSNGFLVSVGDLSRVPAFWSTNRGSDALVPGARMSSASDSGKEEFFRRTANLFTTQSLSYSVYVVAQAGSIQSQGGVDRFVPVSTVTTENVIQLEPIYPNVPPEMPAAPVSWSILKPKTILR